MTPKRILITFVLLAFTLTACGAKANTPSASQNGRQLSPMFELVVGTLKLDGTPQAVTKQQAAELLPLWQVYKGMMTSDTAAQAEIDGLTAQIRGTMTADQIKAIGDMKLTQGDIFSFMRQQGGGGTGPQGQTNRNNNSGQGNSNRGNSGGGQGGFQGGFQGGPPDGGGFPGGGFGGPQASGTRTPNGTAVARAGNPNRIPTPLIEALIQYLEKVAEA